MTNLSPVDPLIMSRSPNEETSPADAAVLAKAARWRQMALRAEKFAAGLDARLDGIEEATEAALEIGRSIPIGHPLRARAAALAGDLARRIAPGPVRKILLEQIAEL